MRSKKPEKQKQVENTLIVLPEVLFTPEEVADRLKVSLSAVYNWVKLGRLEAYVFAQGKRKSTVRFDEGQILRFMAGKGGSK